MKIFNDSRRLQVVFQKVPGVFLRVLEGSTSFQKVTDSFVNGSLPAKVTSTYDFCSFSSFLLRSNIISLPKGDKNRAELYEVI